MSAKSQQDVIHDIDIHIRARYSILYIVSWEEERVEQALRELAGERRRVLCWSVSSPFGVPVTGAIRTPDTMDQVIAGLDYITKDVRESKDPSLFILKDLDPFLDDPMVERKLRDLATALRTSFKTVVIVSPVLKVPRHLEKEITVLDFGLPNLSDMARILEDLVRSVQNNPHIRIEIDDAHREQLLKAALGLTASEAENVFGKALVLDGKLDNLDVGVVLAEKQQIIRKSGLLDYYPADAALGDVGGLDQLKEWLRKRARSFSEKARQFGLPQPRGIMILGVQGCGKSLSAKAVAGYWSLPLLRLDLGQVFGKYVGESEANIREATKVAESIAPCVLWLDEMEKAFGGMDGGADGGTTQRVIGSFLTWLQEKTSPVFVIGTANDLTKLPPELLRKGRLDEIFYVDLPAPDERHEILEIHLRSRSRDPKNFDLDALVEASRGFSGAEIEQAIVEGLYDAFDAGRDLTSEDIDRNLKATVPLYRTMREPIQKLREWARTRARFASSVRFDEPEPAENAAGTDVAALTEAVQKLAGETG